ncbi:MAG: alpha/beta fold hydrolase [Myxococcota bacterium]
MRAPANGLEIEYEIDGPEQGPVLLLVMGLGQQLVAWPDDFVAGFVEAGFRVVRFDNRDIGLSSKIEEESRTGVVSSFLRSRFGFSVDAPYVLDDMASDAWGLMDHLSIDRFHVLGVSMGGMIAQLMAIGRPERVATLTSVMSTTGERNLPSATPKALALLARRRPVKADRETLIAHSLEAKRTLAGPLFPTSEEEMWAASARTVDRMYYAPGYRRHTLAVLASPDRRTSLQSLSVPTLVVHGTADPLVPVGHGRRTAELVPRSRLELIEGWGHDLAPGVRPRIVDWFADQARSHPA